MRFLPRFRAPRPKESPPVGETTGRFDGNTELGQWESYILRLERENRQHSRDKGFYFWAMALSLTYAFYVQWNTKPFPILVKFGDPADRTYYLRAGEITGSDLDTLMRDTARTWVLYKEKIDHASEPHRDHWLDLHASKTVWEQHQALISPENPKNPRRTFARQKEGPSVRDVQIITDAKLTAQPNTYQVFFWMIDRNVAGVETRREWVATVRLTQVPTATFEGDDVYLNPAGLVVTSYAISPRSYDKD